MMDDALDRSAMERESTGAAPTSGSFTGAQKSDMEAATALALAEAADEITEYEGRSLGKDFLALTVIFLIIVTYHAQNPILTYTTQFGRSWRNATFQQVLGITLIATVLALIWPVLRGKSADEKAGAQGGRVLQWAATGILLAYVVFAGASTILRWNPVSAALGVDPALMFEQVEDDTLPEVVTQLETAVLITTVFEYVAIVSVIVIWQPWTRLGLYRKAARRQLSAIVVGVIVLVLWETIIAVLQVQEFLLPRPSVIAQTFIDLYPRLVGMAWITFQNAVWGFVIGSGLGILTGIVSARFLSFSRALLPIAIAINAIPIIALAPIFNNWFGMMNPVSKIALCAVLTYFPAMISTVRGLTSVEPLALELMRSYAASQIEIFRKVRLPNALPYIFSALKVGTTLATIGAIVSEYFGGSTAGLGSNIRSFAGLFQYAEAWAAIVMACLFGILFYLVVSAVERSLLHWHVSFREK